MTTESARPAPAPVRSGGASPTPEPAPVITPTPDTTSVPDTEFRSPEPAAVPGQCPAGWDVIDTGTETPPQPSQEATPKVVKQRQYTQYDDVYITRYAGDVSYIHVLRDYRMDATVGKYHSQPAGPNWVEDALTEAARLCRTRSTIRVHTTESDLIEQLRTFRSAERLQPLRKSLTQSGKAFVLARPERETPIWRELMKSMKEGRMLTPSPLVTYLVHTAAFTNYEQVYTGIVMVGLGTVAVHARATAGDDLVGAELDMLKWVLANGGGGGRIDVHHSSDGARRIWEQATHLAVQQGPDTLGQAGAGLRALVREAARQRTTISVARAPEPMLDRFAKAAACTCWLGSNVM